MFKKVLDPIKTVLENRIIKLGLKKELLKHPDYVVKAKETWEMIDEEFCITTTIENLLKLKIDKFEQTLIKRFPELNSKDIDDLMKKIVDGVNQTQTAELNENQTFKQLQNLLVKLKEENEKLKEEIKKLHEDYLEMDK